jgi:hypothetical protein
MNTMREIAPQLPACNWSALGDPGCQMRSDRCGLPDREIRNAAPDLSATGVVCFNRFPMNAARFYFGYFGFPRPLAEEIG